MFFRDRLVEFLLISVALGLCACGGGGDDADGNVTMSSSTSASTSLSSSSSITAIPGGPSVSNLASSGVASVTLTSDPGDFIGAGRAYSYSNENAVIRMSTSGNWFAVTIDGEDNWSGWIQLPSSLTRFQPGSFSDLRSYTPVILPAGSFGWSGNGRSCIAVSASVEVNSVTYVNGVMTAIDMAFHQGCFSDPPSLHGRINWKAENTAVFIVPVDPPPTELWQPTIGSTPESGNYVYLQSDPGDFIGAGRTYVATQLNAQLSVETVVGGVEIDIRGAESWHGTFKAMAGLTELKPGYYGKLLRWPFYNPARGAMNWSGDLRGCNTLWGWFVVDAVSYSNGVLTGLDVRFGQNCEISTAALYGKIHWKAGEIIVPPGPVTPPPGLWQPRPGATPVNGSYVYLDSDAGDYIGNSFPGSRTEYLYTSPSSPINLSLTGPGTGPNLTVSVEGWRGVFAGMYSIGQFEPGYYGSLDYEYNPALGLVNWFGMGKGCYVTSAWFVVDSVNYFGSALTGIDIRFEQHCDFSSPALRGKIHWTN